METQNFFTSNDHLQHEKILGESNKDDLSLDLSYNISKRGSDALSTFTLVNSQEDAEEFCFLVNRLGNTEYSEISNLLRPSKFSFNGSKGMKIGMKGRILVRSSRSSESSENSKSTDGRIKSCELI